MQDYVHYLEEVWYLWYPLTLQHKEYALFLVVVSWLLTAIFYSIRISLLKRRIKRTENALSLADGQVSQLQTQSEASVLELNEVREQANTHAQQAEQLQSNLSGLEQQLRNKLQSLIEWATADEDNDSESPEAILQRMEQRIERLRGELQKTQQDNTRLEASYTVESAKNAEKEQEIQTLQSRLDNQSLQLSKLEISVAEYKTLETQQQAQLQRIADLEAKLAVAQANNLAPKPAIAPPTPTIEKVAEVAQAASADIDPVVVEVPKAPRSFNPFAAASISPAPTAAVSVTMPTAVEAPPVQTPTPAPAQENKAVTPAVPVAKDQPKKPEKSGGLFGSMMRKIGSLDEKMGAFSNPPVKEEAEAIAESAPVVIETPAQPEQNSPAPTTTESKAESGGLKRLGGFFKKRG